MPILIDDPSLEYRLETEQHARGLKTKSRTLRDLLHERLHECATGQYLPPIRPRGNRADRAEPERMPTAASPAGL